MTSHTDVHGERLTMTEVVERVGCATIYGSITFDACEIWNWDDSSIPLDDARRVTVINSTIYGAEATP